MRIFRFTMIAVLALGSLVGARPLPQAVLTPWAQNPLNERGYQDREILYELQAPESHAFRITHDYSVRRVGEKYYFNVVRAGSHVTSPESIDLDSGEKLNWEIISGKQAQERKLPITEQLTAET